MGMEIIMEMLVIIKIMAAIQQVGDRLFFLLILGILFEIYFLKINHFLFKTFKFFNLI
jgi:hypothetical protein